MKWLLFDLISIKKIIKKYQYLEQFDDYTDVSFLNKKIEFKQLQKIYENKIYV